VATIIAGNLAAFFVPGHPSLLVAAIVRGVFAAITTTLAAAAGYVRGAINQSADLPALAEAAA